MPLPSRVSASLHDQLDNALPPPNTGKFRLHLGCKMCRFSQMGCDFSHNRRQTVCVFVDLSLRARATTKSQAQYYTCTYFLCLQWRAALHNILKTLQKILGSMSVCRNLWKNNLNKVHFRRHIFSDVPDQDGFLKLKRQTSPKAMGIQKFNAPCSR